MRASVRKAWQKWELNSGLNFVAFLVLVWPLVLSLTFFVPTVTFLAEDHSGYKDLLKTMWAMFRKFLCGVFQVVLWYCKHGGKTRGHSVALFLHNVQFEDWIRYGECTCMYVHMCVNSLTYMLSRLSWLVTEWQDSLYFSRPILWDLFRTVPAASL